MSIPSVETIFIVGAGFSYYAGLPLTNQFSEAILEGRDFGHGPSRITVDFLTKFILDAFDHSTRARGKYWPDLEDVFTCVDLAANSGHHLGATFAPADLRTVRRAVLSRIIRMLDQKYQKGRRSKGPDWRKLDDFFLRVDSLKVGFISMNWDTVIERKLLLKTPGLSIDYGCDAFPANIPDPPNRDDYSSEKVFLKKIREGQMILTGTTVLSGGKSAGTTPVIKIHGSANWLYCDNCRRLFWLHPDQSVRVADQLVREDDLRRIGLFLRKKGKHVELTIEKLAQQPWVRCLCSDRVPLGIRIATFSYRKALDFPMFQKSWFSAEELLRSAKKWVFIGYSLPAADYEFKYLLKRAQLCRPERPQFIVVSGGSNRDVHRTYDNYHKFFGRCIDKSAFFSSGLTPEALTAICE
jgi:hypothetical protein